MHGTATERLRRSDEFASTELPCAPTLGYRERSLVVLVGGWLRLSGANWDEGAHLHPDERYIASLANNLRFPASPLTYLDVGDSPLSPYNTRRAAGDSVRDASALRHEGGRRCHRAGRLRPPLLDRSPSRLRCSTWRRRCSSSCSREPCWRMPAPDERSRAGLLAAALYALTVAAIQASHFFTTDVWLVFFGTLAIYLGMLAIRLASLDTCSHARARRRARCVPGFSVASKASGLFVAVPVVIALLGKAAVDAGQHTRRRCPVAARARRAARPRRGIRLLPARLALLVRGLQLARPGTELGVPRRAAGTARHPRRQGDLSAHDAVARLAAPRRPVQEPHRLAAGDRARCERHRRCRRARGRCRSPATRERRVRSRFA